MAEAVGEAIDNKVEIIMVKVKILIKYFFISLFSFFIWFVFCEYKVFITPPFIAFIQYKVALQSSAF